MTFEDPTHLYFADTSYEDMSVPRTPKVVRELPLIAMKTTWEDAADFLEFLGNQEKERPPGTEDNWHFKHIGWRGGPTTRSEGFFATAKIIRENVDSLNSCPIPPPVIFSIKATWTKGEGVCVSPELQVDMGEFASSYSDFRDWLISTYGGKRKNVPEYFTDLAQAYAFMSHPPGPSDPYFRPQEFLAAWLEKQRQ